MKLSFLFGAGAEIGYGMPSGGQFALEIFRTINSTAKKDFKDKLQKVDTESDYATDWLPTDFKSRSITTFGKLAFQNIVYDTLQHNREDIIKRINNFDGLAKEVAGTFTECNILDVLDELVKGNTSNSTTIALISELSNGNALFTSKCFSKLLSIYTNSGLLNDPNSGCNPETRSYLRKILLSIMQLHIGALGEDMIQKLNSHVFKDKPDNLDFLDELGEIFQLDYSASGMLGLELLLEKRRINQDTPFGKILEFAFKILESIYVGVLDYKSLIDSNWHYLYCPKTDWAKFCKICTFLFNVRNYISGQYKDDHDKQQGYYEQLKEAAEKELCQVAQVATTNYNTFICKKLDGVIEPDYITFLNGSVDMWYNPYLNQPVLNKGSIDNSDQILVPLIFTQSGTKPMISIAISEQYVNTYTRWKESDALVIVGFGFRPDDEHINGMIRNLVDNHHTKIFIVTLRPVKDEEKDADYYKIDYARKLKTSNTEKIEVILVDKDNKCDTGKLWIEEICSRTL